MIGKIREVINKEKFNPGCIGFLINPYFFIRRGLYKGIKRFSFRMNGKLLDFGCGNKPYRDLFNVFSYIGLDIEESGNLKEKKAEILYDGTKIPFEDETFDSVFSSEVFEHVFNLDDILSEINRVTKTGGKLLITVPFSWDEHEIPFDFARYTSYGITHLLEKHGFESIEVHKSTTFVTTVFQLWNSYLYQNVFRPKILKAIALPTVLAFNNLICIILNFLLPKNKDLYHNNVVFAVKK